MLRITRIEHEAKPTALQEFSGEPFKGRTFVTFAGEVGEAAFFVEITLSFLADDDHVLTRGRAALFAAIDQLHAEAQGDRQGES